MTLIAILLGIGYPAFTAVMESGPQNARKKRGAANRRGRERLRTRITVKCRSWTLLTIQ